MEHTTKVVNIFHEKYDVYIGRSGKGEDGYFGNPFRLSTPLERGSTISKFREYFYNRIKNDTEFKNRVETELLNKKLGCFCKQKMRDVPCHGDIYIEYFDNLTNINNGSN